MENETIFTYDVKGNLTGSKDAEGNIISHEYDNFGRKIKTIKHLNSGQNIETKFTYYKNNQLETIEDAGGNITRYEYDNQNRTKKIIYPDDTFIEYTYDKIETGTNQDNETVYYRVMEEKQRNGTVVKHFYDQLQRLMKREITPAAEVEGTTLETYEYDGLSRVTKAENDFTTVEIQYDPLNRITQETQMGKLIKYTYQNLTDSKTVRQTIQYPNQRIIERDFDLLNRISKIREGNTDLTSYEYIGRTYRLLTKQYNNGDVINYLYDQGRRLTSKETRNKNSDLINKYAYGYNNVHMKTFEQRGHDSDKGDVFGYDEIYRLKHAKFNSPEPTNPETSLFEKSKTINFDKVDNILKIIETQNDQTNEIVTTMDEGNAKLNQYTTFDQWGLDYDLNGNTIQKGTQFFTYDYRNQLVSVTDSSDNSTVNYKYDALGRRISKQLTNSPTHPLTYYYYSGNQVIEERDGSDNVLKQYIYGNGIDETLRMDKYTGTTATPYYFHNNGIGSVTAITDQDGNLIERVSYDIYGMPTFTDYLNDPQNPTVVENSVIGNDILFQGRRYDKETNLYYFRARYYDPIMGRFLQTDPMGYLDSMNLYQAFNMNPVNFMDPFGEAIINLFLGFEMTEKNQMRRWVKVGKFRASKPFPYPTWDKLKLEAERNGHTLNIFTENQFNFMSVKRPLKTSLGINVEIDLSMPYNYSIEGIKESLKDEEVWTVYIGHSYQNKKTKKWEGLKIGNYYYTQPMKTKNKYVAVFSCSSSDYSKTMFPGADVIFMYDDRSGEGLTLDHRLMNAAYAMLLYMVNTKVINPDEAVKAANDGLKQIPFKRDKEDVIISETKNRKQIR